MKLASHPYSHCFVFTASDGTICFDSYSTRAVELFPNGEIRCYCICSATTRKQIGWFMREYTYGNYYDAKNSYLTDSAVMVGKR